MFTLEVHDEGLRKFRSVLQKDFQGEGSGPVAQGFKQWGEEYAQYIYDRFHSGGGDQPWQALAGKTIRRKGHGIILVDTTTLQEAFRPGSGVLRIERTARNRITVSLQGGKHPKSKRSIEELANIHHLGRGKVPSRPIWVQPPQSFESKMKQIMIDALNRLKRQTGVD